MGIRVLGLEKSFASVRAVVGVDLEVDAGELLVLLGQNGAGKSTTLRCAGGILKPDAGRVEFDDLSLPGDVDAIRRRLGVVPDQARLYGRTTAIEYLDHFGWLYGVPPQLRRRRIAALLERFDLAGREDQPLAGYSRGMSQKIALIRATLHEPSWIFCDEPTAGLDPVAAADMREYLGEQRSRGAALIVTTHILGEAELIADKVAIMRRGRVLIAGRLDELRRQDQAGRRFEARLSAMPADPAALLAWLRRQAQDPRLEADRLSYGVPWGWTDPELAAFASRLQRRLAAAGSPLFQLEAVPLTLETVYLEAMSGGDASEPSPAQQAPPAPIAGIRPSVMARSLALQPSMLRHFLPFYVSSWWRRGDLPWVMWLNAFVLLLVAGASLFGSLPGGLGAIASRAGAAGAAAQGGLLLPLFFMSFALLESIKISIGIWWEKAQQSLEVFLYVPMEDASVIWLEVLPGAVVSTIWVTVWMGAGLALLSFFGRTASWDLLPVFALIAALTAYWAAMGRMLGFMLFPREGASGGAWSFLLSPVSAAVADLPLALFVFHSPLAPASLLLPLAAGLALTAITGATFDRERLLETGVGRSRPHRRWLPAVYVRRHAAVLGAGLLLAAVPAGIGGAVSASIHLHSWPQARAELTGQAFSAPVAAPGQPPADPPRDAAGVNAAAAVMAGVVGALTLAFVLVAANFAAFFFLGLPELLLLMLAAALWGVQAGFGPSAPLAGWLTVGGGLAVLGLALNTAAGLPIYSALVFGAGRRLDRLRTAWTEYFALYRYLVLPCCGVFGITTSVLLLRG